MALAPTPWRYEPSEMMVYDANGLEVADIFNFDGDNGPIIATAPDMLAALESIVKLRGVPTSIQPNWTAIHSLIQKAKGK